MLKARTEIFKTFCELEDYNKQQSYRTLIGRRRNGRYATTEDSRYQRSFKYMLILKGGSEVRVCKQIFCDTFGVTARRVQVLTEKIIAGNFDVSDRHGGSRQKPNRE